MVNGNKNIISAPTKTGIYFDKFINDFIFKFIDSHEVPKVANLSRFSYETGIKYTILDALINRDINMVKLTTRNIGYVIVTRTGTYPTDRSLIYLNINYIANILDSSNTNISLDLIDPIYTAPATYVDNVSNKDNNYIFSTNFYNQDREACNLFEKCVLDYLNGKLILMSDLKIFTDNYMYWDLKDQFYKIPILLLLLQDQINNIFSPV